MDESGPVLIRLLKRLWRRLISELTSRRFWKFLAGTFGGLATDLIVFSLLVALGVQPGFANVFSATAGLLVVYFLVTKYAFQAKHEWWRFGAFVGWYAATISFWAVVIQVLAYETRMQPIFAKMLTIPFSFALNFIFSRALFGQRFWDFIRTKFPFKA